MNEKACRACGITKPLDAFHMNNRVLMGRHNACRACRSHVGEGRRYDGRERKENRDFSRAMAAIPAFNTGVLRCVA